MLPLLLARLALASPQYPAALADEAGMPCTPTCTVCHATNAGGADTVTQPFGGAMMDAGLVGGGDTEALVAAFATLAGDGTDSDGDGTADADELATGDDPNGGEPLCGGPPVVTPRYGCFAPEGGSALVLFGAVGLAASIRRRLARQPSPRTNGRPG